MAQQNPMQNQNQNSMQTQPQEVSQPPREKRFLVEETAELPRGGSNYLLAKGKTISSHGYDIAALKRQGVKLKEVSGEPGN